MSVLKPLAHNDHNPRETAPYRAIALVPLSSTPIVRRSASNPAQVFRTLRAHRQIIFQMAKRDMIDRYRGSMLGFLWSVLNPVLMLTVYTFVFTGVFHSRWPNSSGRSSEFALNVFAGMIVFTIFSDCISRAPTLVLQSPNLVKKVVFPLEVLPWVTLTSSLFHALVSYLVLLAFVIGVTGSVHATALLFPLAVLPVALLALGMSWFLASLGVFFRDASHTVGILVMAIMFVSPIFYPVSAVPESVRWIFQLSPLARSIEDSRAVVIQGHVPNLTGFGVDLLIAYVVAWAGLWWFVRTKHAFADVL
jgi:lipopolysaccharide transport system permease protein